MQEKVRSQNVINLTDEILRASPLVRFDPERILLQGSYEDQLSAYRARKIWQETFERCFLLDDGHDFECNVISDYESHSFTLRCYFLTACARYAFWRLTNQQAPEAQYMIETAHIPHCESRHTELLCAPDLAPVEEGCSENVSEAACEKGDVSKRTIIDWVRSLIR